jgi:hypothetical protein
MKNTSHQMALVYDLDVIEGDTYNADKKVPAKKRFKKVGETVTKSQASRQRAFMYNLSTSQGTIYDVHSDVTALKEWVEEVGVDAAHQELIIQNLSVLPDCRKGSAQYIDIMDWINAPIIYNDEPFTFATCCRVIGIEDAEIWREQFFSMWEKINS